MVVTLKCMTHLIISEKLGLKYFISCTVII